ncbi:MAG: transposase [Butyrivibrio sp.]|nr:transposase [Butyrivibrio sp.]
MQVRTKFSPAWERNEVGQKDILLKDYFTPDIFADAINAILYDGKSVVTPERMRTIDIETQHVEERDGDISADARFRDLAKIVEVDDAIYCLFAIEHQSVEDYTMPLITIVMYWKADKWNQPVSVKDMFDKNTVRWLEDNGLGGYIQDYRMHLFEPCAAKEEKLEKFKTELKDVIAYVKYSKSTEDYVFIDGKERLNMCEAFEGIKAEGIEEGRKEGIEEGRKEGIKEGRKAELKDKYKSWVTLSRNLEKKGMSSPEIASSLGISEAKLAEAFEYMEHLKEDAK